MEKNFEDGSWQESWHEEAPAWLTQQEQSAWLSDDDIAYFTAHPEIRVGFTAGAMDLCHGGHDLIFEEAKVNNLCDVFLVFLQVAAKDRPDKNMPVQSLRHRFTQVRTNRYVDKIRTYQDEAEFKDFMQKYSRANGGFLDVRLVGDDYRGRDFTGKELPIELHYNWRGHDWSTSSLRQDVVKQEAEDTLRKEAVKQELIVKGKKNLILQ